MWSCVLIERMLFLSNRFHHRGKNILPCQHGREHFFCFGAAEHVTPTICPAKACEFDRAKKSLGPPRSLCFVIESGRREGGEPPEYTARGLPRHTVAPTARRERGTACCRQPSLDCRTCLTSSYLTRVSRRSRISFLLTLPSITLAELRKQIGLS